MEQILVVMFSEFEFGGRMAGLTDDGRGSLKSSIKAPRSERIWWGERMTPQLKTIHKMVR